MVSARVHDVPVGQAEPPLSDALLSALSAEGRVLRLDAGDVLFREGDAADAMYLLLSGRLKVFASNDGGREVVYNELAPGELFGEMLLDGGLRSASVRALETCDCLVIAGGDVHGLLHAHPEFAEVLVLKLIARLRRATRTIRAMALEGVYERVAALLEQVAVGSDGQPQVPRTFTQIEIARRVGASREMVNQVLRDLVRGGFIHKDRAHRMTLLKPMPERW